MFDVRFFKFVVDFFIKSIKWPVSHFSFADELPQPSSWNPTPNTHDNNPVNRQPDHQPVVQPLDGQLIDPGSETKVCSIG